MDGFYGWFLWTVFMGDFMDESSWLYFTLLIDKA